MMGMETIAYLPSSMVNSITKHRDIKLIMEVDLTKVWESLDYALRIV